MRKLITGKMIYLLRSNYSTFFIHIFNWLTMKHWTQTRYNQQGIFHFSIKALCSVIEFYPGFGKQSRSYKKRWTLHFLVGSWLWGRTRWNLIIAKKYCLLWLCSCSIMRYWTDMLHEALLWLKNHSLWVSDLLLATCAKKGQVKRWYDKHLTRAFTLSIIATCLYYCVNMFLKTWKDKNEREREEVLIIGTFLKYYAATPFPLNESFLKSPLCIKQTADFHKIDRQKNPRCTPEAERLRELVLKTCPQKGFKSHLLKPD